MGSSSQRQVRVLIAPLRLRTSLPSRRRLPGEGGPDGGRFESLCEGWESEW